ncbi:MAG: divergent PAP2 family protein [Candidatus Moranbacteria bacterium]|nr:divergent PAP2 family protein [Candidatus Moranbacteria bacterium]
MLEISKYYSFILPIVIWVLILLIKIVLYSLKHGGDLRNTLQHVGHGHMPSAHTGFIVSLVTAVGYYQGIASGAFAVAFVLAIITIDDAVRLRMYMGDQGRYLNKIIENLNLEEKYPKLKERMGHRLREVIVGGLIGFAFTLALAKLLG